jgi:hypothetical protein
MEGATRDRMSRIARIHAGMEGTCGLFFPMHVGMGGPIETTGEWNPRLDFVAEAEKGWFAGKI